MNTSIQKINELHNRLSGGLKKTVEWAIEIGRLLAEEKEKCEHGKWLEWVDSNCVFKEKTAQRYLKLYEYRAKTTLMSDLQEAYLQIEYLEKTKKEQEKNESIKKYKAYKETGEKPEGWTRADDYNYKQHYDDNARTERLDKLKKKMDEQAWEAEKGKEEEKKSSENIDKYLNQLRIQAEEHDRLAAKISAGDGHFSLLDVIAEYLTAMSDPNRSIEACHIIIKYCKEKANEYQVKLSGIEKK